MDSYGFTGWPRCRGWGSGGAPGPGCSRGTQLGPHGSCDRSRRRVCALPAEKLCLKKQLESCRWGQGFTFAQQHCWAESWPWTGRFGHLCPYHAGRGSGRPPDRRGNWGAKSRTFPGVETHHNAPPCREASFFKGGHCAQGGGTPRARPAGQLPAAWPGWAAPALRRGACVTRCPGVRAMLFDVVCRVHCPATWGVKGLASRGSSPGNYIQPKAGGKGLWAPDRWDPGIQPATPGT